MHGHSIDCRLLIVFVKYDFQFSLSWQLFKYIKLYKAPENLISLMRFTLIQFPTSYALSNFISGYTLRPSISTHNVGTSTTRCCGRHTLGTSYVTVNIFAPIRRVRRLFKQWRMMQIEDWPIAIKQKICALTETRWMNEHRPLLREPRGTRSLNLDLVSGTLLTV